MPYRKIKGHQRKTPNESKHAARNQAIYTTWLTKQAEMSQEDIGKEYGLTKQRVGQIIKRQGEIALAEEAEK